MANWTRRGFLGSLSGVAAATSLAAQQSEPGAARKADGAWTDQNHRPPVRHHRPEPGEFESSRIRASPDTVKPSPPSRISSRWCFFIRDYLLGEDPTDVRAVMLKIRRLGAFKPWGSAVSAIEIALWDIAGQVAGVPVYKLLGGKIRDRVRAYNGGVRFPMTGQTPQDYAENMQKMKEAKEGFTLIKQAVGFHNPAMMRAHAQRRGTTNRGRERRTPIAA